MQVNIHHIKQIITADKAGNYTSHEKCSGGGSCFPLHCQKKKPKHHNKPPIQLFLLGEKRKEKENIEHFQKITSHFHWALRKTC